MKILRHRADFRSVVFVLFLFVAMALQWSAVFRHPLLYVLSHCFAFIALVINHNHQHVATFARRSWNRVFGLVLSLVTGQPASAIVPMHNLNHHVYNNRPQDFVRTSLVQFRWNFLNLLLFPFLAVAGYAKAKSEVMRSWKSSSPRLYRQLRWERAVFYPAILLLLTFRPLDTLLYLIAPYLTAQWGIIVINLVQHDGCDPDSEYNHCRNLVGRWTNWWLFNNGYHAAHHLHPGLHWSELPACHENIRGSIDPRLERRSLFFLLVELYAWPGRRPESSKGIS